MTTTPPSSAAPTAAPGGDPEVSELQAAPNPCAGPDLHLALRLSAPADGLLVRLYSPAFTCVLERRLEQRLPAGWSRIRVAGHGLAAGLVYARLKPVKGGKEGRPSATAKVLLLP